MKLSRAPSLRKKGVRRIKSELYKAYSNGLFGEQIMDGLQLCSINKPKSPEGYYYKAEEVLFGVTGENIKFLETWLHHRYRKEITVVGHFLFPPWGIFFG